MGLELTFNRNEGVSLKYQLRVQLEEMILRRKLTGRLPSETDLCESLKISRGTVRAVLDELLNQGLIYKIQGKGTYVNENQGDLFTVIVYLNQEPEYLEKIVDYDEYRGLMLRKLLASLNKCGFSAIFKKMPLDLDSEDNNFKSNTGRIFLNPRTDSAHLFNTPGMLSPPVVILGAEIRNPYYDIVALDNEAGISQGIDALLEAGHRSIGYIGAVPESYDSRDRYNAFRKICGSNHLIEKNLSVMLEHGNIEEEILRVLAGWDREGMPTAVITGGFSVSLGLLEAAEKLGLEMPGDLSVVGFDDFKVSAYLNTPLASIRQPLGEMADAAVGLLREKMLNPAGRRNKPKKMLFAPGLVRRASCGKPGVFREKDRLGTV